MSVDSRSTTTIPALRPLPPRTSGLPLLGALPALPRHSFDFLLDARVRHGEIYTLDLGVTEAIVLNHPRHIQHVLVDNVKNYYKGGGLWDGVRAVSGNGLVVSEGDFWLRQLVAPATPDAATVSSQASGGPDGGHGCGDRQEPGCLGGRRR